MINSVYRDKQCLSAEKHCLSAINIVYRVIKKQCLSTEKHCLSSDIAKNNVYIYPKNIVYQRDKH